MIAKAAISPTPGQNHSLTRAGHLPTPASSLWELCFRKHSKPKLKALSPSKPVPQQGCSPLQNPDIGTESSRFQPSARPGGRSRSASPSTGKCCVKASKCNTPRGKINKELDQQQTLLRTINSMGISQGFLVLDASGAPVLAGPGVHALENRSHTGSFAGAEPQGCASTGSWAAPGWASRCQAEGSTVSTSGKA